MSISFITGVLTVEGAVLIDRDKFMILSIAGLTVSFNEVVLNQEGCFRADTLCCSCRMSKLKKCWKHKFLLCDSFDFVFEEVACREG